MEAVSGVDVCTGIVEVPQELVHNRQPNQTEALFEARDLSPTIF